jgi:D-beta-D-heptose 7-phosphate kinase/D-beta-D-heptose 1-phosphate adenosyltransferase
MSRGLSSLLYPEKPPRILIVGDMILDRYQYGAISRISPEAPIVILAASGDEHRLGGCGNVLANLAALGAEAHLVCIVGDDDAGSVLRAKLSDTGCSDAGLVVDESRPTTRKTRVVSQNQQLLRIDEELVGPPPPAVEDELLARIEELAADVDIVVISDYGKGVLTPRVLERLCRAPGRRRVLVDPKGKDYARYRGASLITPNKGEAETATGLRLDDLDDVRKAAKHLGEGLDLDAAIITLGAQGMYCRLSESGQEWSIPARARAVYDVTGAGDTVIALLAYSLAVGSDMEQAMRLATVGAGLTVQRFGVAAITRDDIESALNESARALEKVLNREGLLARVESERALGRRIVFTNGCFDVLHVGHLSYLQESRAYGDVLIVGINSDASVRRLKGDGRPVNTQVDRMALVSGLECVSLVAGFEEDTPLELIEAITPDVLVKGEDWADKGVVGRDWVEKHGGHVVLANLQSGYSSTTTLQKLGLEDPS